MTKGDVVGAWGRGHLEYVKPTARLITFSSSLSFLSPWPEHFQRGSRHGRGGTRPDSRSEHTRIQAAQAIRRPKWVSRPRSAEISWRAAPDSARQRPAAIRHPAEIRVVGSGPAEGAAAARVSADEDELQSQDVPWFYCLGAAAVANATF